MQEENHIKLKKIESDAKTIILTFENGILSWDTRNIDLDDTFGIVGMIDCAKAAIIAKNSTPQ